ETVTPVVPAAPSQGVRVLLGATVLADLGSFAAVNAGVTVTVGLTWRHWRLRLGARGWLPQHADLPMDRGHGGDFGLYTGVLSGCYAMVDGARAGLDGCIGVEAGIARGAGVGVTVPEVAVDPWVAPGAEVVLRVGLARASALVLTGGAVVPLVRPEFVIEHGGTVFQPAAVAGRLG